MATYNKYYNYPNIDLWDGDKWEGRISCVSPLARWIQAKNHELGFTYVSPGSEEDAGFEHDFKYLPPETKEYWKNRGMRYDTCGLGAVCLIPERFYEEGMTNEPPSLLVLCESRILSPTRVQDIFHYYNDYNEMAAKEGMSVIYVPFNPADSVDQHVNILQELAAVCHLKLSELYLDVSTVYKAGETLATVPGFTFKDTDGNIIEDPDSKVVKLGDIGLTCLDITGNWWNEDSLTYTLLGDSKISANLAYDKQRMIHSPVGREIAEGLALEYKYSDARDPGLIKYWDDMGLKCEFHHTKNEQWITFVPKCAYEEPENRLPVMVIFQEVNDVNTHQAVMAYSYCYGMHDIAAMGDCILLYFVLETADDNDLLVDILKEAEAMYPIDMSRVYLMGHSHDGGLASHYIRRHPREIAAVATLGVLAGYVSKDEMGPHTIAVEDEDIEYMRTFDMPTIVIDGCAEKRCHFPLNDDIQNMRPDHKNCLLTFDTRAESWQRRLRGANCPERTLEEIIATRTSSDYVERQLGIPADKTEVLYLDGTENYIADIKNNNGDYHLRVIGLGNMPHTITPIMCRLLWSYVRRFKRDPDTGEVIELY